MADIQGTLRVLPSDGTNDSTVTAGGGLGTNLLQINGTTVVTGGTAGLLAVAGPAASGSATSGNPLLQGGVFNTTQPTVTTGQVVDLQTTARGGLIVSTGVDLFSTNDNIAQIAGTNTVTAGVAGLLAVGGPTASGATTTGNPLLQGAVFNTTQPTVTTGQIVDLQATARGGLIVATGVDPFSVSFGEVTTGIVTFYGTVASVANNATGTVTYTVTAGKTLYLKQIVASSSSAIKIVVDYGAGPTVIMTGFTSSAQQVLTVTFAQPIAIAASTAVNVKMTNRAGAAQDVYATIIGHEI